MRKNVWVSSFLQPVFMCSLSQVHIKSLIVTVTPALCCVPGNFQHLFQSCFLVRAYLIYQHQTLTTHLESVGFMSRNDAHWGLTSVGEGSNEQITCYDVKAGHVDP